MIYLQSDQLSSMFISHGLHHHQLVTISQELGSVVDVSSMIHHVCANGVVVLVQVVKGGFPPPPWEYRNDYL